MRQQQLNIALAIRANVDVQTVRTVIAAAASVIRARVKAGDIVTLRGLGSFYVDVRRSHIGRNPRTQEPLMVAARKEPALRFKKAFRRSIDE